MPDIGLGAELFSNSEWAETVEVRPKGAATNESGYAIRADGDPFEVDAIVRPVRAGRAWRFQRSEYGLDDGGEFTMITQSEDVSPGDQVNYRDEIYEAREGEPAPFDDFYVFELHEVSE